MKKLLLLSLIISTLTAGPSPAASQETQPALYPYAVNLDNWEQPHYDNDAFIKNTMSQSFYREDESTSQQIEEIVINANELNSTGKGIYIATASGEYRYYPITVETIPTKEIIVLDRNNQSRTVFVNTAITIQYDDAVEDSLNVVQDVYYLFYNKQGGISLASRDFSNSNNSQPIDRTPMWEFTTDN